MHNPWKPDPDDDRVPIGPGDTVDSMQQTMARIGVILIRFCREVMLKLQAAVDAAQELIAHIYAFRGARTDHLSFAQKGFGLRHGRSVGEGWNGCHSGFLHRRNLS